MLPKAHPREMLRRIGKAFAYLHRKQAVHRSSAVHSEGIPKPNTGHSDSLVGCGCVRVQLDIIGAIRPLLAFLSLSTLAVIYSV